MTVAAPSSASDFRALHTLREATAASHARLETRLGLDADAIGLGRYVALLAGLHSFLGAWETQLSAALPPRLRPWFAARSRRPWARHDLAALGVASAEPGGAAPSPLPIALGTLPAVFGSLYVIEGSALGGLRIARQAQSLWGLDATRGASYFHGWGAETGPRWRAFCDLLEAEIGPAPPARAAACAAAVATFDALDSYFHRLSRDDDARAA